MTIDDGEEIHDKDLNNRIELMAKNLGMSVADLVMQFDTDPDSLPDSVKKDLSELQNDRFVRVIIMGSKEQTTTTEQSKLHSVVLIPILIPFFKRREGIPDEPEGPTIPSLPHSPSRAPIPNPEPNYQRPSMPTDVKMPEGWIPPKPLPDEEPERQKFGVSSNVHTHDQFNQQIPHRIIQPDTHAGGNNRSAHVEGGGNHRNHTTNSNYRGNRP